MQFNKPVTELKLEFTWTDELAIEFAKVCSQGAYGEYRGCKKVEQKLERFKKLVLERVTIAELGVECSICEEVYIGFGNNAQPINDGRCCDSCNTDVVMARIELMQKKNA